jgi:hypothetical protein
MEMIRERRCASASAWCHQPNATKAHPSWVRTTLILASREQHRSVEHRARGLRW